MTCFEAYNKVTVGYLNTTTKRRWYTLRTGRFQLDPVDFHSNADRGLLSDFYIPTRKCSLNKFDVEQSVKMFNTHWLIHLQKASFSESLTK